MFFKKMACSFGLLVLAFCYNCGAMAQGQGGEIEPINSGFVFVDGKYLEAPYRAEVRDLVVLINGIQITQPPYIRPNLIVTEDPGVPAGLTKEVGLDDFRKIKWEERIPFDAAKLAYIVGKYSKEEVQEKMLAYYRSLPCIKKAECVGGYGIRLTD